MNEKINEAERDFKSLGTIHKKFTIPLLFWEEWKKDCYERFNGTYYLKMMHDHEFNKSMSEITQLVAQDLARAQFEIAELREELSALQNKQVEAPVVKEQKEKNLTFGWENGII